MEHQNFHVSEFFTVHASNGTSCDLLLFHPGEEEPYAIIPFQNHIRSRCFMITYDLHLKILNMLIVWMDHDEQKGLLFDKTKVLG